jgi:chaperonin GroES
MTLSIVEKVKKIFKPNEESPFLENIAVKLSEDKLRVIGRTVKYDYDNDLLSRAGLDKRMAVWHKLFVSLKEAKSWPWPKAANVKLPILPTACLQYHARAVDNILTSKDIAKCMSTDGKAVEQAERCQNYLNYQLTEDMDEWLEETDVLMLLQPVYGGAVKKTYYDFTLRRVVSRTLSNAEFVAPYGVKRLEDAPRKTHVIKMHLNDIKIRGENRFFVNTEDIKDIPGSETDQTPAQEHQASVDKNSGIEQSAEQDDMPRTLLEQHRTLNIDGKDGAVEKWYMVTVDYDTEKVLRIESLDYKDPVDGKIKTYDYFTAFPFIPNPDSWMGLGYGHILEHINVAANSLTNQLIDAGTLANTICGFFNQRSGLEDGDLEWEMGRLVGVDASSDDLRKSIMMMNFNQPSNVLFQLQQMLHNYGKELASVTDSILGKMPPSDTTATSVLTMLEQGLKLNSTINQRTHRSLKKEFKKIALLNSLYIDEDKYFMVQDSTGSEMVPGGFLAKDDFRNYIDVMPHSNPNISSKSEKLIKARSAYELLLPRLREEENQAKRDTAIWKLEYNLLDALEIQNIDQILPKPEPPPPPPDLTPVEEEAQFLREVFIQPLPHQDHNAHLKSHQEFGASDMAQQRLTPQGKKLLETHIKETNALSYLAFKESEEALRNEEANITGGAGMAGGPVYTAADAGLEGLSDQFNAGFGEEG